MTEWLRGGEGVEPDAAAELVAELALRGLLYLKAVEKASEEQRRKK